MEKKKILIVDDENFFVEPIKLFLEKNGFTISVAGDGMSGFNKARSEKPDLIILDLMLPGINGFQICRLLKFDDQFKNIPIVIVSAKDTEQDRILGKQSGADLYITKPVLPASLIESLNRLMAPGEENH